MKRKKTKSNHEKYKKLSFHSFYRNLEKKKKKEEKERETYLDMLSSTLNLPSDILTGAPIITIIGKGEISVENYKRIIEYTDKKIRILTSIGIILIQGNHLKISYFANEEMKITGRFHSMEYKSMYE